jgi:hypothetical protein
MKILGLWFCCCITLFFSCQNQSIETQTSDSASIEKLSHTTKTETTIKSVVNVGTVDRVTPNSTLDSLQGAWISSTDERDHVKIISRNYIETYEGDTTIQSTHQIFFADTCIDDILSYDDRRKLNGKRESGRHMVLVDILDSSGSLCFRIDYVNKEQLVLDYGGKTLEFHK